MKHKHADIIKAWADGVPVQFYNIFTSKWEDVQQDTAAWYPSNQYRIKPKPISYRVAQTRSGIYAVQTHYDAVCLEASSWFVRWLSDWAEAA